MDVSFDESRFEGLAWTYCDINGGGSNVGLVFETSQLGVMTIP